eukprot:6183460-Pleurochrysis_carterae.AAC.1
MASTTFDFTDPSLQVPRRLVVRSVDIDGGGGGGGGRGQGPGRGVASGIVAEARCLISRKLLFQAR